MRATQDLRHADVSLVVAQLVLAGIVGLIVAPGLLADPARVAPIGPQNFFALSWFAISLLIGIWLVVLAPSFVHLVADPVASVRLRFQTNVPATAGDEAHNFARWLVVFGEILLAQAMLRPPLVVLLSGALSRANAEALVAALTLAILLLVLIWVHRSARPLVVTAARSTLDVFLASTDSDTTVLATPPPATTTHRRTGQTGEAATQAAPLLEATRAADANLTATLPQGVSEATVPAPSDATIPDPDVTLHVGTEPRGGGR